MRRFFVRCLAVLPALALVPPAVSAREPFTLDVTVDAAEPDTGVGFTNIDDLLDALRPEALAQRFPGTNPTTDGVDVLINFRGIEDVGLDFASNSGVLGFVMEVAGIDETFTGRGATIEAQREDALEQLEDYLKENKDALKRLLEASAKHSPIDPLAGNPLSLMTRSMKRDFANGFTHKVSQVWGCNTTAFNRGDAAEPLMLAQAPGTTTDVFADAQSRAAALRGQNEIGWGAVFQTATAEVDDGLGDFKSASLTLPLSYTVKFDGNPGHKLRFELPLSTTDADGGESYSAAFGVAYSYPISEVWSLTPALGIGAVGSDDLVSAGGMGSFSLTSAYTWRLGGWGLSMGNSVGRYESLDLKIGDVEATADIRNSVTTNGFMLTGPSSLLASNMVMEWSIVDTRLSGDDVYAEYYDEAGVALGFISTDMGLIDSYYKLGASYIVADHDIDGFKLNLAAWF